MTRIDRRRFLRFSGAAAVAASTGGTAGILASGRAPAYGQSTSLQWLKFVDFVPVSDQLLRGKITEECQKALGIKLNIETIEGNGIQPRITSAIQSATGPDIIMAINNWPQLYGDSVADVSEVIQDDPPGHPVFPGGKNPCISWAHGSAHSLCKWPEMRWLHFRPRWLRFWVRSTDRPAPRPRHNRTSQCMDPVQVAPGFVRRRRHVSGSRFPRPAPPRRPARCPRASGCVPQAER